MSRRGSKKQNGLKAAVLTMSFVQMATNAVSVILADIAAEFPNTSVAGIQYLMTFPNLLIVVVSLLAAGLSGFIKKRALTILGLLLVNIAGIGSFVLHNTLYLLYVWAGLLGIGVGLVVPMANSLITDYFQGEERNRLLGYQTGSANAGSMLMTYVGGILATGAWYFDYLVYLFAVPGLLLTLKYVPTQNAGNQVGSKCNKKYVIPGKKEMGICILAAIYMVLFFLGPTNLALYIEEQGIGNTMIAGNASALLLSGGVIMGFFYGRLAEKIGKQTITVGFCLLAAGYLMIYSTGTLFYVYSGCFLLGMSNPLVMPQCMGSVANEDKRRSTVMMSVVFAAANLGTFFAPGLTSAARIIMESKTVESRFLFAGILSVIGAALVGICLKLSEREK